MMCIYESEATFCNFRFIEIRSIPIILSELATDEDKANQIDYWARLFKASSWEEVRMISKNNNYLSEASQALYELNADEITRQKCRAREEYYRTQNTYKKLISDLQVQLEEKDNTIAKLMQRIAELEGNS